MIALKSPTVNQGSVMVICLLLKSSQSIFRMDIGVGLQYNTEINQGQVPCLFTIACMNRGWVLRISIWTLSFQNNQMPSLKPRASTRIQNSNPNWSHILLACSPLHPVSTKPKISGWCLLIMSLMVLRKSLEAAPLQFQTMISFIK